MLCVLCCAMLWCAVPAVLCPAALFHAVLCYAKLQLPNRLHAAVCLIRCSCKQTTFKAYAVVLVLPMQSCWSEQQAYVSTKQNMSPHPS